MRRLLLALAFLACADATSPKAQGDECYAFLYLEDYDGMRYYLWTKFDPCPSDAELEATGWHKAPKPEWWQDA